MSLTIAQINSAVKLGLGDPDKSICDAKLIHYAVRNAVAGFTRTLRSSDTNRPLSTSATFTPTAAPYNITSLVSRGVVAWVEVQEGQRWRDLRCVPKAQLEDAYDAGENACAMWTDESNITYLDFSYPVNTQSSSVYRLQFDKDIVNVGLGDETVFPESLSPLIELSAQNTCIARIKLNLSNLIEDQDEQKRKTIALQLNAWDGMLAQNALDLKQIWLPEWRTFKNRTRTAQNQRRLPNKSGRGLYGG
jgi:hypothetical protein